MPETQIDSAAEQTAAGSTAPRPVREAFNDAIDRELRQAPPTGGSFSQIPVLGGNFSQTGAPGGSFSQTAAPGGSFSQTFSGPSED